MTWYIDFSRGVRADLVGLDVAMTDAITDTLADWLEKGPPLESRRTLGGVEIYEAPIAERYLLAYVVDDDRRRFVLLWLRHRPGVAPA